MSYFLEGKIARDWVLGSGNWKTLTKGDESGERSDSRRKTAQLSPSRDNSG